MGLVFKKCQLPLFSCGTEILKLDVFVPDHCFENSFELGVLFKQFIKFLLLNSEDFGVFQGFNVQLTLLLAIKTSEISYPVIFCGKLNVVLKALIIYAKHSEAPWYQEIVIFAYLFRRQKFCSTFEGLMHKSRSNSCLFLMFEWDKIF